MAALAFSAGTVITTALATRHRADADHAARTEARVRASELDLASAQAKIFSLERHNAQLVSENATLMRKVIGLTNGTSGS